MAWHGRLRAGARRTCTVCHQNGSTHGRMYGMKRAQQRRTRSQKRTQRNNIYNSIKTKQKAQCLQLSESADWATRAMQPEPRCGTCHEPSLVFTTRENKTREQRRTVAPFGTTSMRDGRAYDTPTPIARACSRSHTPERRPEHHHVSSPYKPPIAPISTAIVSLHFPTTTS